MLRFAFLIIAIACLAFTQESLAGGCYRPFQAYVAPAYHYQPYYVPYVIEVQVHKDRYYSLSDLYRDRLYLEAFDLMKEMRGRLNNLNGNSAEVKPGVARVESEPTRTTPQPSAKGSLKAATILQNNCFSCHGKDNKHLDLTDPNSVSLTKRRAAFGLIAAGDMPPPPANLLEKGKEKELSEWKQKNALKDDELKILYDEWVLTKK